MLKSITLQCAVLTLASGTWAAMPLGSVSISRQTSPSSRGGLHGA